MLYLYRQVITSFQSFSITIGWQYPPLSSAKSCRRIFRPLTKVYRHVLYISYISGYVTASTSVFRKSSPLNKSGSKVCFDKAYEKQSP